MAHAYLTTAGAQQLETGRVKEVKIVVNASLVGTVAVIDGTSGTAANVALITNPLVGQVFEYWHFKNGLRLNPSTACDLTVSWR